MNTKQKLAIERLEKAFYDCSIAGIVFIGMDASLLAFDRKKLIKSGYGKRGDTYSPHDAMRRSNEVDVNTHNTYLDSGGW